MSSAGALESVRQVLKRFLFIWGLQYILGHKVEISFRVLGTVISCFDFEHALNKSLTSY